jgi:ABC-2 type transport system permease protein
MNWPSIFAIVRKDVMVITRTKGVMIPIIVVPLVITVFVPAVFAALPQITQAFGVMEPPAEFQSFIAQLPASFQAEMARYTGPQLMVVISAVYYFAPMYLILPMMVSSVVAADSLAGEKERKTLESLLYTPTTDLELLIAKVLGALLPALAVAWGGFVVYAVVLNTVAWPVFGAIFFPNAMWWLLALWVAPAVAGMGLGLTVLISARVGTFQEAYQMGSLIVLPVVALMVSQGAGLLYFGPGLVFVLGLVAWLVNALLVWLGVRAMRRSSLLLRL